MASPLARLFLGTASHDNVLAAAGAAKAGANSVPRCQAYFSLGEYALLAGRRADAAQFFQQSVATGQKREFAYLGVSSELRSPADSQMT